MSRVILFLGLVLAHWRHPSILTRLTLRTLWWYSGILALVAGGVGLSSRIGLRFMDRTQDTLRWMAEREEDAA